MHKYLPQTPEDIKAMCDVIGVESVDDLFSSIPGSLRLKDGYDLPEAMGDDEIEGHMRALARQNSELIVFRGAGSYDHHIPAHISALLSRQEFLTSYTPYQPEVAQGTLQYIFEYQSMVTALTGMDVSNASMYDGATATAEAMFMAYAQTGRKKVLVSDMVHPKTIDVVRTYARYRDIDVVILKNKDGQTDLDAVRSNIGEAMGLIVQTPNHHGVIEDLDGFSDVIHDAGALMIVNAEGLSMALLKTPGELGADIATGDLQSFGVPMSFGGATIGYLASTKKLMRKMPGRICGITEDVDGKRAFVLTLQAREQHIRRAKANSNICSNQSLMALAVTIYLSTLGKRGLVDVARQNVNATHALHEQLLLTGRFKKVHDRPFFNEFVLEADFDTDRFDNDLLDHGILGPLPLQNRQLLFCVTEKRTPEQFDLLLERVVKQP